MAILKIEKVVSSLEFFDPGGRCINPAIVDCWRICVGGWYYEVVDKDSFVIVCGFG